MAPTASFVALEDAGEPVRDPELSRAWKANDMKATLFALSQFLHRDQMDRGRTACTARGNLDDLQRDSLSCPIRLSAQTKGLTDTRVSRRHALDKLGIKPSMLEKRNRLHGLTDSGVAPWPSASNYNSASFWGRFDLNSVGRAEHRIPEDA